MDSTKVITLYSVDFNSQKMQRRVASDTIPGFVFSSVSTTTYASKTKADFFFFGLTSQVDSTTLGAPVGFVSSLGTRRWSDFGYNQV